MTKLTGYNIGICLVVCIGGFTYGFGFPSFVTSMGQPGFYQYFKLERGLPALMKPNLMLTMSSWDSPHCKVLTLENRDSVHG